MGRRPKQPTARVTNTVRERRTERGLTQQQLADAVGVTRQTVNAIEGEKYAPSLEVAFLIARTLDAMPHEVFTLAE